MRGENESYVRPVIQQSSMARLWFMCSITECVFIELCNKNYIHEYSLQSRKEKERGMSMAVLKHFGKAFIYFGYENCLRICLKKRDLETRRLNT